MSDFSVAEKEAIYRLIRSRRDIRHFRPDPVPAATLQRILEMAHYAPSVGFMQPWNFIIIESLEIRRQIKDLFETQNARELDKLTDPARKQLYEQLKLEGILESPLNLAVTCDRRRDAPFVLGRAPMPDTDLYSTCLAIENLWLAARAEGIGLGWVSILDRQETEALLAVPAGVQLVAYLCLGYPVEFRAQPMLEELGWKHRLDIKGLVFQDRWGVPTKFFEGQQPR